jgi:hypothetical protein
MTSGFFAKACKIANNYPAFTKEFNGLTHLALDEDKGNYEFWEIFNSKTGKPDGGYQDAGVDYPDNHWKSCRLQTWSATAYLDMVFSGLAGMVFSKNGLTFNPYLPDNIHYLKLSDLNYNNSRLSVEIIGNGNKIKTFLLNGIKQENHSILFNLKGVNEVTILME